jgi:hypothetical protein
MKLKQIWTIIFILSIILVILALYFYSTCAYNKMMQENLIVSPSKPYSTNDKNRSICNVRNKSELGNKQSYINIDMLIKIKDIDPRKRLGSELIGYKLRAELSKYKTINIFAKNQDTKQYMNDYNDMVNKQLAKNNKLMNDVDISGGLDMPEDLNVDKDYYYKCEDNTCWYNITVVNHIYINPQNIHKISWTNRFGEQETKWVNLHSLNIRVPIMPRVKSVSKLFNPLSGATLIGTNKEQINDDYYYEQIEVNDECH